MKPEDLEGGYHWDDRSLILNSKKRPIHPLHPQWVFLFRLKEKQPHKLQGCYKALASALYRAMAHQQISFNITDLLLAHDLRKTYYRSFKQKRASNPPCEVAFSFRVPLSRYLNRVFLSTPKRSSTRWAETHPGVLVMVTQKGVLIQAIDCQAAVNDLKYLFICLL